jgi:carbamoyltransferase
VVKEINHAIKMRDFWMPFAGTVLDRRAGDYLESGCSTLEGPYMMTAFETRPPAHRDLAGAIHPHDLTMRPQILEKGFNPLYYSLIERFEKRTGLGGVLNTSFNLHGEPVVCGPEDALHTMDESSLNFLLTDRFVVEKVEA